jgi:hypothetical protein
MCLENSFKDGIRNLAYRYYCEEGKGHGHDLEDWDKAKRTIFLRVGFGIVYLVLGILICFEIPQTICFLCIYGVEILWCFAWSLMGAGAGLINTRNHPQNSLLHLLGYWFFIIVAVSLTAFTLSLYKSGDGYSYLNAKFYSLSALIGLIGGFLGHVFYDIVLSLSNKLTRFL